MADISQIRLPSGDTFDLIDEKSGYITAQYIENKTDYSIPVSRAGEIIAGETAIGTDSTNFPTSKAVVDYVDERVVQEMDAIDVGVTGIKANGTSLAIENGVVNIPAIGPNQTVGLMTGQLMQLIENGLNSIPTSTSQLTNDSGFLTSYTETDPTVPAWAKASTKPTYTANEVGALPSDTVITDEKLKVDLISGSTIGYLIVGGGSTAKTQYYTNNISVSGNNPACLELGGTQSQGKLFFHNKNTYGVFVQNGTLTSTRTIVLPDADGTFALTSDIPTVPTNISSFTNDSGYLTASDIASVMTYKGTKANYAALPASGNTTGDVWHLTDTGAEWAWDGSAWQELGTAIDLSGYATKATTLAGYGIIDAKIQNGTITLGSNTITPLTSFTETDPTVPSWAKQSSKPTYGLTEISGTDDLRAIESLTGTSGLLKKTAANTWTLDTNTYLTSYTETDPVFSASAAAGITATDISNWNAKVSDDKTWNGVTLNQDTQQLTTYYVPTFSNFNSTSAKMTYVTSTPSNNKIVKWDSNSYLYSTTPSANDNSTKVATTAYVDAAIPKVYSSTNTGGYLTMATLPIYDGTVV